MVSWRTNTEGVRNQEKILAQKESVDGLFHVSALNARVVFDDKNEVGVMSVSVILPLRSTTSASYAQIKRDFLSLESHSVEPICQQFSECKGGKN